MSKITKLLSQPGPFFRDLLIKRFPERNSLHVEPARAGSLSGKSLSPVVRHDEQDLFAVTFPIDVVYTWVDGSDAEWHARKLEWQRNLANPEDLVLTPARFACRGELKYSLRSLEAYAPWVNRIYIVTAGQIPAWLDTSSPRIKVIDHREIIPAQYLPTFNSHVIEANLHRIPGLSEHYVYFNDDVMLTRPLRPEHFFASNGNAHVFATRSETAPGDPNRYDTPTARAAKNVRCLIDAEFGHYMRFNFAHTYHPQLKSVNERMRELWKEPIEGFLKNRFRHETDLAVATYLFPNVAYLWQRADVRQTSCLYFNIRLPMAQRYYDMLLARRGTDASPHSMCLNDVKDMGVSAEFDFEAAERHFLEAYFPSPSSFELPSEAPRRGARSTDGRRGPGAAPWATHDALDLDADIADAAE